MHIALLGYGTVGKGIAEMLDNHDKYQLVKILRHHASQINEPRMCLAIEDILQDDSITLIVEAMSGVEPAYTYIKKALEAGKHVVSANKAVIAMHQVELHAIADAHLVTLRYEASCGGGIPWIMAMMKAQRIDEINRFRGILNGTCNYILDEMTYHKQTFANALALAQTAGFAEADPTADISGMDTQRKATITARLAFHVRELTDDKVIGIENITSFDIEIGKEMGCVVKLLASGMVNKDGYELIVEPTFIPVQCMEASIHAQYNIVTLHGETVGDLTFSGQGAGSFPTANALLQDILDMDDDLSFHPTFQTTKKKDETLMIHSYLLRSTLDEAQIKKTFLDYQIDCGNGTTQRYYLIYHIPASTMHEIRKQILVKDALCFIARIMTREDL